MKFSKTLASVCAATVALSSLAVSAFAVWDGADSKGNLILNVADILPKGVDINDVYGVRINFTDASADVLAQGAGGGFILSTKSNNWNQLQWCNGCGEDESHDIQLDVATKSITRMEETPFFTADDISGADGNYAQIALSEWWGGDIAYSSIDFLNKDGEKLPVASDDVTPDEDLGDDETPDEDTGDNETPGETEDPAAPGDTEKPAEPGDTTDPVEPGDTTDPVEPGDTTDPVEPGDTTDPEEPDDNNKPGDTTKPAEPDDPIVNPDDNNKPADDDNNKPADDNNKPADDNKNPASPDTGVTAAVLPAALAAASLAVAGIVLKKRK